MNLLKAILQLIQLAPRILDLLEELKERKIQAETDKRMELVNRDMQRLKNAKTDEDRKQVLRDMAKWN